MEIKLVGERGSRELQVSEATPYPELESQIMGSDYWHGEQDAHTSTELLGHFTFTRYHQKQVGDNWVMSRDMSNRRCSIVGMAQVSGQDCRLYLVMQYDPETESIRMRMLFRVHVTETCNSTSFMDKDVYKLLVLRAWEHVQTFTGSFTGPVPNMSTYARRQLDRVRR